MKNKTKKHEVGNPSLLSAIAGVTVERWRTRCTLSQGKWSTLCTRSEVFSLQSGRRVEEILMGRLERWLSQHGRPGARMALGHACLCYLEAHHQQNHVCTSGVEERPSFATCEEEHNEWNKVLALCCHFYVGPCLQCHLTDIELGTLVLSCRFALCILCKQGAWARSTRTEPSLFF